MKQIIASVFFNIRGQSNKYLALPPDGVTIAREIYYRAVHSRSRSFVLTACGFGRVRGI